MQFFHSPDGARLAYRDEGAGLPLLALAGLTRDGRDFDYLARGLGDVRLIRLDCRGRGGSDWTGAESYTVPQEAADAIALLDHLELPAAAVIGSSRGGLLGMFIALTAPARLLGLCLNDVGPVLERAGLLRIGAYIGVEPTVSTLAEISDRMPSAMPGFRNVPAERWAEETVRHYRQGAGRIDLPYDPALRQSFDTAMSAPPADGWPLFEACADLPLALIRGAGSDVLSPDTAAEMRRRRPDMLYAEIPDRGHIPFLDERAAQNCIQDWMAQIPVAPLPSRTATPPRMAPLPAPPR